MTDVLDLVASEWARRTVAEYQSAAIAQHVTLWLILLGAPPDLIRQGLRIAEDELVHSELSAMVAAQAQPGRPAPRIDRESLDVGQADLFASLESVVLRFFCIGETLAVPLFRLLRTDCTIPVARTALDRVVRDEPRHRQFGWDLLDWMLLIDEPRVLNDAPTVVLAQVETVREAYRAGPDPWDSLIGPELAAWGIAPSVRYETAVAGCLGSEIAPRFASRGISLPPTSTASLLQLWRTKGGKD